MQQDKNEEIFEYQGRVKIRTERKCHGPINDQIKGPIIDHITGAYWTTSHQTTSHQTTSHQTTSHLQMDERVLRQHKGCMSALALDALTFLA